MAEDPYYWARDAGLYIEQDQLCQFIDRADGQTLVVDVRDDDNLGGAIVGAVHHPDGTFDVGAVAELAVGKTVVVFHCMESARRAPRCARRLHDYWVATATRRPGSVPQTQPRICVLQGGADLWIRRFWQDATRVVDFDSDYWGFGDSESIAVDHVDVASHRLYTRPADQPATSWSEAGPGTDGDASLSITYRRDGCRPLGADEMQRAKRERLEEFDDRSVGCVVFAVQRSSEAAQQESGKERCVLMIKQREPEGKPSYWAFPKGHVDEGETDEECASRETMEEAGVSVSLRPDVFAEVGYSFIKQMHTDRWRKHPAYPDEAIRPMLVHHKIVRYYMATTTDGMTQSYPCRDERQDEVEAVEWVACTEAEARLAHEESKAVFRKLLAQCDM